MRVLGINAAFHDQAAALVVDGEIVAAAEEERFSRRKHGKAAVPFSAWEQPEQAARWCLEHAGIEPAELDAVAYSYDPALAQPPGPDITAGDWEGLRTLYARRAPLFLRTALSGLDSRVVRFVPHHVAHAASAYAASPYDECSVLVLDGRGESASHLSGRASGAGLRVLATQPLPHSLGLLYEALTEYLGFARGSDEYKVMALASYGEPRWLPELRDRVWAGEDGGFRVDDVDFAAFDSDHADLACSVQRRLEEVLLDLAGWLHEQTGDQALTLAGGVALNCVANSRIWEEGPFEHVWVQPAAGDAGTALGAALYFAAEAGERVTPMATAALGRGFEEAELERTLRTAGVPYGCPNDLAGTVADTLAAGGIVAWFQGRSEFGPRALGHRSLLGDPRDRAQLQRLNDVKGREQFRPVAPMVLVERAGELFEGGPLPSPYMLFVHRVRSGWAERMPAVVHVDGTARIQTVDRSNEPLMAAVLDAFCARTGVPVVVNTSLNTAGRPMVDSPRDALELFGSAPVDLLVLGPFTVAQRTAAQRGAQPTLESWTTPAPLIPARLDGERAARGRA